MPQKPPPKTNAPSSRLFPLAIVVSRYNATVTDRLLEEAAEEYAAAGGREEDLIVIDAPGAYELPILAYHAAKAGEFAGVLALGCIIKGETRHDEYIAHAVAQGLVHASLQTGVPIAFGVLTAETPDQARERAGGAKGNKGREAMAALIETVYAVQSLSTGKPAKARRRPARPDKAARP